MILQHFTELYALTVFCFHCPLVSSQSSKACRQAVSLSVTSFSSSSQVVSRSVNRSLSVCLSVHLSLPVSLSLFHSLNLLAHSVYAFTDLYREFRSIHLRDTLVEVSDYHWFPTLQTKVMDLYPRLHEDKSLRLQRVKKAYSQRADSSVRVRSVKTLLIEGKG